MTDALQQCWCFSFLRCSVKDNMDNPSYGSPVRSYVNDHYSIHVSNDGDTSEPNHLFSLGVVDLDLSISPDAFGLRAFDVSKPLTCLLPGQFTQQLRLFIPDLGIAQAGFHDVVIENHAATPTWRSRHLPPGDVTYLRRRWPKAVFRTMQKQLMEMEQLRQRSCHRPEWEFCHNWPGFCSLCQEQVATPLDTHMMNVHLELEQLWRCPLEWCTVNQSQSQKFISQNNQSLTIVE